MIDGHVKKRLESHLRVDSPVTWEPYDKNMPRSAYEKVHYDPLSDEIVMKVVDKPETFVRINQYQYLSDILHQQRALVAQVADSVDKAVGTSSGIDYNKPPKNFADAMSSEDAAEWMEAYRKEYQGFKDRDAVKMVIPPRGAKVHGSKTGVDYKVE